MASETTSRPGLMAPPPRPTSTCLFQVHLRLRPPPVAVPPTASSQTPLYPDLKPLSRFLTVEPVTPEVEHSLPTHITLNPPSESRKRAVEKFAFTKVFEEQSSQLDIFIDTGAVQLVEGVLAESRDGLLATLGVTGSGKSHTILGTKSERGLTQMSLDLVYQSLKHQVVQSSSSALLLSSLKVVDAAESDILSASSFLEASYGDIYTERFDSRATTPLMVGDEPSHLVQTQAPSSSGLWSQWSVLGLNRASDVKVQKTVDANHLVLKHAAVKPTESPTKNLMMPSQLPFWKSPRLTRKKAKLAFGHIIQDNSIMSSTPRRHQLQRPSALPTVPDLSSVSISVTPNMEYAILVSMYEVYNDRIFDLLCHAPNGKELRRRPLLFKSTEMSQDRKVVAGLRKVVCGSLDEALMVLETGLVQRRVAGTGSNSVSSRSHGFFCVEVKKRPVGGLATAWNGAQLTIVDLAGSERARNAKTAGATLAEAGKINESLMYLGQCLQMQSDSHDSNKPSIVPFRQCKLTELLFSNSFPSHNHFSHLQHPHPPHQHHRNPQRGIMIVTADPLGDFNATSQILRYSAMAREITVPRIPSVSSTILSGIDLTHKAKVHAYGIGSGRTSPDDGVMSAELEAAQVEMERLAQELEVLGLQLEEERERRLNAEENWQKAESRAEEIEAAVREEVWAEMDTKMELERVRWMNALEEQGEKHEEHLDQKLEILSKGVIQVHEDEDAQSQRIGELEDENAALHRKLEILERQMECTRSPTKTKAQRHHQRNSTQIRVQSTTPEPFSAGHGDNNIPSHDVDNTITQLQDTHLSPGHSSASPRIKVEDAHLGSEHSSPSPRIKLEPLSSPPPRMKLLVPSAGSENGIGGVGKGKGGKSPGKKMRKLTPRTRTIGMEEGELGLSFEEGDENVRGGYY